MKKIFLLLSFAGISMTGFAQQNDQQPTDDQLQQQPARESQVRTERAAKVEAVKAESNKAVDAEMTAKQKGQTQKQTKAQPVGINPTKTDANPKKLKEQKKIISEDSKSKN